jgi:hypothetical protein
VDIQAYPINKQRDGKHGAGSNETD